MDYNRMTLMVQQALQSASHIAIEKNHTEIDVDHISLALLEQKDGIATPLFDSIGVGAERIKNELEKVFSKKPTIVGSANKTPHLSINTNNLLIQSEKEMKALDDEYISAEHIILRLYPVFRKFLSKGYQELVQMKE